MGNKIIDDSFIVTFVILYNECILLLSSEENQLTEGNESLINCSCQIHSKPSNVSFTFQRVKGEQPGFGGHLSYQAGNVRKNFAGKLSKQEGAQAQRWTLHTQ